MKDPFAPASTLPVSLQSHPAMPGRILEKLSPHPFALPFADQTTVALPIKGGPLKLFLVIPAIVLAARFPSALCAFFRRRIRHIGKLLEDVTRRIEEGPLELLKLRNISRGVYLVRCDAILFYDHTYLCCARNKRPNVIIISYGFSDVV